MRKIFFLVVPMSLLAAVFQRVPAQEGHPGPSPRLFEFSTRGLPVSGTLSFVDGNGTALKTETVENERYFWSSVPEGAVSVEFSSAHDGGHLERVDLIDSSSTFVNVNPTRPVVPADPALAVQSAEPVQQSLTRLPLIEEPRAMAIVPEGDTGWIFVGKLQSASDDSEWSSLYLLDSGTLKKPDAEGPFPYSNLKASVGKTFVADFPLVLRSSESDEGKTGFPILRGGQSFEILRVVRAGDMVRAEVRVKGVTTN